MSTITQAAPGRVHAARGRAAVVTDTWFVAGRHLMELLRQPWFVAITIVQPMIWLVLFGGLFRKVVEIPGFAAGSYLDFLAPGVVVMTAFFSGSWSGMGVITDLKGGVMDRFLTSPVSRSALLSGRVAVQALTMTVQSLIIIGVSWAMGAHFPGGAAGLVLLVVAAVLVGCAVSHLSLALALLTRQEESLIGASQMIIVPASFLSSTFMATDLAPGWIRAIAHWNPMDWAVVAGREALAVAPDWTLVWTRLGWLAVFMVFCAWLSTRAFRAYQKSV
jgi:ABC-2 type transport system permease protein